MENAKRLEALEAKRKQLDAQIQALRVREQTQARKDDTRRKVLIGGVMLKMVKLDEMPEGRLTQLLEASGRREGQKAIRLGTEATGTTIAAASRAVARSALSPAATGGGGV